MKELNDALVLAGVERIVNDLQRVAKARKMHIMAVEFMMRSCTLAHASLGACSRTLTHSFARLLDLFLTASLVSLFVYVCAVPMCCSDRPDDV
jgi:hypothetical protein